MGARGKNFYNDLACRYGYAAQAEKIQDLYLEGKKAEAKATFAQVSGARAPVARMWTAYVESRA